MCKPADHDKNHLAIFGIISKWDDTPRLLALQPKRCPADRQAATAPATYTAPSVLCSHKHQAISHSKPTINEVKESSSPNSNFFLRRYFFKSTERGVMLSMLAISFVERLAFSKQQKSQFRPARIGDGLCCKRIMKSPTHIHKISFRKE